jgi:hypothetical protein
VNEPLPIAEAATLLGVSVRSLRRWIADGAPVARFGGGRGRPTLVHVDAIRAWQHGEPSAGSLRVLADQVPEILAAAMFDAFRLAEGAHKRALAGSLAAAWLIGTDAVLEAIRAHGADVPHLSVTPRKVANLRQVFAGSGTVSGIDSSG